MKNRYLFFTFFFLQENSHADFCSFNDSSTEKDLAKCIVTNVKKKVTTNAEPNLENLEKYLSDIVNDQFSFFITLEDDLVRLEKALMDKMIGSDENKKKISIFTRADLAQQFRRIFIEYLSKKQIQPSLQSFLEETLKQHDIYNPEKGLKQAADNFCNKNVSSVDCINQTYFNILNSLKNRAEVWGLEGDNEVPSQKENLKNLITETLSKSPSDPSDQEALEKRIIRWMIDAEPTPEEEYDWQPLTAFFKEILAKVLKKQAAHEPTSRTLTLFEELSGTAANQRLQRIQKLSPEEKEKLFLYIKGLVALFNKARTTL